MDCAGSDDTITSNQRACIQFQNAASEEELTSRLAPPGSPSRAYLDRAIAANDVSLLIQEMLVCIESARAEG